MKRDFSIRGALVGAALLGPALATLANPVVITDGNSSFTLNHEAESIVGTLPFTGDWVVDGRRILTYVSAPANLFDIGGHHHPDSHVAANQLHAAGPLLAGPTFLGGLVYTVDGDAPGSGRSRLVELVEVVVGAGVTTPQTLTLTGFGFRPTPHGGVTFEIPDLSGLTVTGTTLVFAQRGSFATGPFQDLTVLPFHSFTGFNTFSASVTLNPDTTLRMITELNVAPGPAVGVIPEPSTWLLTAAGLAWLLRRVARVRAA